MLLLTLIAMVQGFGSEPLILDHHFPGFKGTFVLHDPVNNLTRRYNSERSGQRFTPCSTFKIAHSLIALDSGTAPNPDYLIAYDAGRYPRRSWMSDQLASNWLHDHTLATAFKYSVVWYYREMAQKIGPELMVSYLDRLAYGNKDISSGLNSFWLSGSMEISADEQVQFLRRMHFGKLGVSDKALGQVKELMVLEQVTGYRLLGKTGSNGQGLGWLVGFLETPEKTWIYAYNAQLPQKKRAASQRKRLVKNIFKDLHLISPDQ